jgi:transmembrane sensor
MLERRLAELLDRVLRGEATREELDELAAWRSASPVHEERYRQHERLAGAARLLRRELRVSAAPTAAELLRRGARTHAAPVVPHRSRWVWATAVAAAVVAAAVLGRVVGSRSGTIAHAEIVTGTSELATVQLRDGSVIRLAPMSRLQLSGRADAREVTLDGRAFFAVAKAEGRPFLVHTRAAAARVLGTRFELATGGDALELVVVEGHVALDALHNSVDVLGGETSRVARGVATRPARLPDAKRALAWVGKFLVFQSTPLLDAAREVERAYGVRVVIVGSVLATQTVTAAFADRDVDQVTNVLCSVVGARCTRTGDVITMSRERGARTDASGIRDSLGRH